MIRPSTIAVVAGALGALLLVAALRQSVLGVLVGAMLSPLPLAMVAFGLGGALLPLAIVSGAVTVMVVTGSFPLATAYLALDAAPVAVLSRLGLAAMLKGGTPLPGSDVGRTVSWLVLAAVAAVVTGLAMASMGSAAGSDGIEAALKAQLDQFLAAATPSEATAPGSADFAAARAEMARQVAGLLPGAAAWNWCSRAILSAGLGQLMLTKMSLAMWPTPDYRGFEAPKWFFALFGAAAIAAMGLRNDAGFIAGNAATILSLPLVLQGLAVVHSAAAGTKQRLIWLAAFYVGALVTASISWTLMIGCWGLLVGLGAMDSFLQIRARYLTRASGGE